MILIFEIAAGVVLGGSVLLWLQRRAEQQRGLREARAKGQEAGQQIVKLVHEQSTTYLAALQTRLLSVLDKRIEMLGGLDETLEEQQGRNRKEIQSLLETVSDVDTQVADALKRNVAGWTAFVDKLELQPLVDMVIQEEVATWKEGLVLAATDRIVVARRKFHGA